MNTSNRLVAFIEGSLREIKTKHYIGFPPPLTGGKDTRVEMERAAVVAIEPKPDGIFLCRYTADGRVVGDTWHMTVDDAKHQATYEFGDSLSPWKLVPSDNEDVVAFCLGT